MFYTWLLHHMFLYTWSRSLSCDTLSSTNKDYTKKINTEQQVLIGYLSISEQICLTLFLYTLFITSDTLEFNSLFTLFLFDIYMYIVFHIGFL